MPGAPTITAPPTLVSSMRPFTLAMDCARSVPLTAIAPPVPAAVAAVRNRICRPSAVIVPKRSWMIAESTVGAALMVTWVRPSPTKSRVTAVPAPKPMLPPLVTIAPLFHRVGPTNASPFAPMLRSAWLRTWWLALGSPLNPLKTYWPVDRPLMKSPEFIHRVEATSPPTLTAAPLPKVMPAGLIRNTLPLALRLPSITDADTL